MKIVLALALAVFSSGCLNGEETAPQTALREPSLETPKELCIEECRKALNANVDLSRGPCLSNQITEDWVCDVAHTPRIEVDNQPENQCEAFRRGEAHHFVELDTECNLLKVY